MIKNNTLVLAVYEPVDGTISCYIEKPSYVEYTMTYNSGGSFKIVAQLTKQNAQAIKKDYFVYIEGNAVGIIKYIKMTSENSMTIGGTLCDSIFEQRAVLYTTTLNNVPPYVYVSTVFSMVNYTSAIPRMAYVNSTTPTSPEDLYTDTIEPGNALEIIQNHCKRGNIGYRIIPFNTQNTLVLKLETYQGDDVSENVIMSNNYESISDFEYTASTEGNINFVHVRGKNNVAVEVTTNPAPTGFARHDYYLDCTGVSDAGLTDAEYKAILTTKGQEIINEHQIKETYSGTYTGLTFQFGIDYNLGDIVKVVDEEKDISTEQQVTSFRKQFDSTGVYSHIDFGEVQNNLSSVTSSLVKRVERVENYENQVSNGGASITLGPGLKYDNNGKLTLDLGSGLAFNSNQVYVTYDPVVNVTVDNAILLKRSDVQ